MSARPYFCPPLPAPCPHKYDTQNRVYAMPHAVKAFSFRRGTYPASIHCLAFSPEGYDPPLLAAASGHGSIHIFR